MSGARLIVGTIVNGIILPVVLFFLLHLTTFSQFLTVATCTFLSWGVSDLLSSVIEKPRLKDRSPAAAIREEWENRKSEE